MHAGLGGFETLNLYAEAIAKMPENPGIPLLFRNIFKNAYLPSRDPETLKMFLKVIDEFSYDHSERLGDAFEYLLSVLGSQGDAGQFRTPRHIIDFMVAVVDPQKTETVLDPACSSAGFLISSYKHILRANTDASGNRTLTPDEPRPPGAELPRLRHFARHGAPVAGEPLSARLRRPAHLRVRHADQPGPLERVRRCDPRQPALHVAEGGHQAAQPLLGAVEALRGALRGLRGRAPDFRPAAPASLSPRGSSFRARPPTGTCAKMLVDTALVAVVSLPAACSSPIPASRPRS